MKLLYYLLVKLMSVSYPHLDVYKRQFLLYTDRQWPAVAAMGAALICLNQNRIGHRLMKKNLIADVKSAFPKLSLIHIYVYKRQEHGY